MELTGNTRSNAIYEYHVPAIWEKPHPEEDREYRELYIREKYEKKSFMQKVRESGQFKSNSLSLAHWLIIIA